MARKMQSEVVELKPEVSRFSEETRLLLVEIQKLQGQQQKRLAEIEERLQSLPAAEMNPAELRQELIKGIHLLGEKVAAALKKMDERLNAFSQEVDGKLAQIEVTPKAEDKKEPVEQFGNLKENQLLEESDFEIVPRDAINRLLDLTKRQALAIKKYIDEREQHLNEIDKKIKQAEEKYSSFQKLVSQKVKQNFVISMALVVVAILVFLLIKIL